VTVIGADPDPVTPGVELYWIPLGAGAHVVRISGRFYEALTALVHGRPRRDLYHTALVVRTNDAAFAIESAPIPDDRGADRGVVAEGAVGMRRLGRFRLFRYEIRRWRDGSIPDLVSAVASPVRPATDAAAARRIIELLPTVPTPVWGRDELRTGDMWNSNSVVSWVLVRSGIGIDGIEPPPGGRAPGWDAGVVIARRATADPAA
jgi:hypothetical protein